MAIATRIGNDADERLALAEPDRKWELWDGLPRVKPGMTFAHNEAAAELGHQLRTQLDRSEYRVRGDEDIWFLHPYEHTLIARRRQPDGTYTEERYTGGIVPVAALPGVTIDLDALLDG